MEMSLGLGFLTGPLIGSIMFSIGGYSMPFFFSGCAYSSLYPFVVYNLNSYKEILL